jgi:hypothetical protein
MKRCPFTLKKRIIPQRSRPLRLKKIAIMMTMGGKSKMMRYNSQGKKSKPQCNKILASRHSRALVAKS